MTSSHDVLPLNYKTVWPRTRTPKTSENPDIRRLERWLHNNHDAISRNDKTHNWVAAAPCPRRMWNETQNLKSPGWVESKDSLEHVVALLPVVRTHDGVGREGHWAPEDGAEGLLVRVWHSRVPCVRRPKHLLHLEKLLLFSLTNTMSRTPNKTHNSECEERFGNGQRELTITPIHWRRRSSTVSSELAEDNVQLAERYHLGCGLQFCSRECMEVRESWSNTPRWRKLLRSWQMLYPICLFFVARFVSMYRMLKSFFKGFSCTIGVYAFWSQVGQGLTLDGGVPCFLMVIVIQFLIGKEWHAYLHVCACFLGSQQYTWSSCGLPKSVARKWQAMSEINRWILKLLHTMQCEGHSMGLLYTYGSIACAVYIQTNCILSWLRKLPEADSEICRTPQDTLRWITGKVASLCISWHEGPWELHVLEANYI